MKTSIRWTEKKRTHLHQDGPGHIPTATIRQPENFSVLANDSPSLAIIFGAVVTSLFFRQIYGNGGNR
jgi:hypothetical protein